MYWAGAYITSDRLDRTQMTHGFHSAPLSLAVPVRDLGGGDWVEGLSYVFRPFRADLWACFWVCVALSGIAFALAEPMNHADFEVLRTLQHAKDLLELAAVDRLAVDAAEDHPILQPPCAAGRTLGLDADQVKGATVTPAHN